MKYFVIAVITYSLFSNHDKALSEKKFSLIDTTITHLLDGKVNDWPAEKFQTDNETQLQYAVDNDKQNLYLVLSISNFREQLKIMRDGMDLYLDPKARKKEGKGIEFPVKREQSSADVIMNYYKTSANETSEQETLEQKKAAMKALRAEMALGLSSMKVFGFSEDKSEEQGLVMAGSANVAFAWDSTDAMNIEYRIPLAFFGTPSSTEKDISIGWKINGSSFSANHSGEPAEENRHGAPGYGGHGGGGYREHGGANTQHSESLAKDQSFWMKYAFK